MNNTLRNNLEKSILVKEKVLRDTNILNEFLKIVEVIIKCYKSGNRLYVAGNGGSAADAQHFVAEFVSKLKRDRDPLPAESLTTDSSVLTAIGNDYGFEHIFSRQLKAKLKMGDIFLGISTSGNSKNLLSALNVCKNLGNTSIMLLGAGGGKCLNLTDYSITIPSDSTAIIQELHIVLEHSICEEVEKEIFFSSK